MEAKFFIPNFIMDNIKKSKVIDDLPIQSNTINSALY